MKDRDFIPEELFNIRSNLLQILSKDKKLNDDTKGDVLIKKRFEEGNLIIYPKILSPVAELMIVDRLISSAKMRNIWRLMKKRSSDYKPVRLEGRYSYSGHYNQYINLYAACLSAKWQWINASRRTPSELEEYLKLIANKSIELSKLLLEENLEDVSRTKQYIDRKYMNKIFHDVDTNPNEYPDIKITKYNFSLKQWAQLLIEIHEDILPSVPDILEALSKKIVQQKNKLAVLSQPNPKNAESIFFVRVLSDYFSKSYGSPLHAYVAAVANAVLGMSLTSEKVRNIVRIPRKITR